MILPALAIECKAQGTIPVQERLDDREEEPDILSEGTMKAIIASSALLLATTPALAADLVYQEPIAPEVIATPETFSWSGPYIGLQGGGSWLRGDLDGPGFNDREHFNGGILGGFVGYNYLLDNNVVLGAEGDLNYNWNEKGIGGGVDAGTDLSGSVRARVGYALDNALIYATAGWAVTRGYADVPGAGKDHATFNGYTVGAGVDYAFTQKVFGRAEYRFSDYGEKSISGIDVDPKQHTLMIGIGVKF